MERMPTIPANAGQKLERSRKRLDAAHAALAEISPANEKPRGITVKFGPLTLETGKRRRWRKAQAESEAAGKDFAKSCGEFREFVFGGAEEALGDATRTAMWSAEGALGRQIMGERRLLPEIGAEITAFGIGIGDWQRAFPDAEPANRDNRG
jgi:hypothetical protein